MPPTSKCKGKMKRIQKTGIRKKRKLFKQEQIDEENNEYECDLCSKVCLSISDLNNHINKQHKITNLVIKGECETIEDKIKLKLTTVKKINCKMCPKVFKLQSNYELHIENEHYDGPNAFWCDHCSVKCKDKQILEKHITSTHFRYEFECGLCGMTFVRAYHVTRHLKQGGCKKHTEDKKHTCEICPASFSRKDNLMVHLRNHISKKIFKCKYDQMGFSSINKLIRHWEKTHSDGIFVCNECGHTCKARSTLSKHLESHGEKKYQCTVCKYRSHTVEVMRRHVLRHTADKPYKCDTCGASFIQVMQLRKHLYRHSGNRCPVCLKVFKKVSELEGHAREHRGLEKLTCPHSECKHHNEQFPTLTALKIHLATHDPNSKLVCELCLREFPTELNLRKHMVTHQLERPRRCMYCVAPRAYVRGEMLLRHVRTRHPAIFKQHLDHVREVMGNDVAETRVKKNELESILTMLDATADRILEHSDGNNVFYCVEENAPHSITVEVPSASVETSKNSQILNESQLSSNLEKLLVQLIDEQTLRILGWPEETVDTLLERVIENCGQQPADRARWSRVQCLRENAKHLFVHVIEDKTVSRMLSTHTIDQVVLHILNVDNDNRKEYILSP